MLLLVCLLLVLLLLLFLLFVLSFPSVYSQRPLCLCLACLLCSVSASACFSDLFPLLVASCLIDRTFSRLRGAAVSAVISVSFAPLLTCIRIGSVVFIQLIIPLFLYFLLRTVSLLVCCRSSWSCLAQKTLAKGTT